MRNPSLELEVPKQQQVCSYHSPQCYLSLLICDETGEVAGVIVSVKVILSWFVEIFVVVISKDSEGYQQYHKQSAHEGGHQHG